MEKYKIDFVIAWVDGNDPEWRKQKNEYNPSKQTDNSNIRYRDMDILKYWFRAVSEYAPWVNMIQRRKLKRPESAIWGCCHASLGVA